MKKEGTKKKVIFSVELEMYPFKIIFCLGEKRKNLKSYFKNNNIQYIDWVKHAEFEELGSCTFFDDDNLLLIRLSEYPQDALGFGILQHEIFHAVTMILDHIGLKLKMKSSDEAYAYLTGYLTQKVYENLGI